MASPPRWLTSVLNLVRSAADDTGRRGERLAQRHLRAHGYRILGRNLRNRLGEVDLLAEDPDGRTVVIVEVKTSEAPAAAFQPEWRVGPQKQRKLTALAAALARRHRLTDRPIRFDIIAVQLHAREGEGTSPVIRHHRGAFEAAV